MDPQQHSGFLQQQQMAIARQQQLAAQQGEEHLLQHGAPRMPLLQDTNLQSQLQQQAALAQAQAQQAAAMHAAYSTQVHKGGSGLLHSQSLPISTQEFHSQMSYFHQLPDSLSHSSLLNAALDPTGSLSHIDVSLLGTSPPGSFSAPASSQPSPVVTTGLTAPKLEASGEHGQQGMFVEAGSAPGELKVRHPEVGDVIGDGSMSHEDVIQHFKQYAMRVGFSMTRNFDNLDSRGRHRRVRIACKQGGLPRRTVKHENPALQRERTSQKVGCPFEVTIWRTKQRPGGVQSDKEQWVVTNVKGIHHGPCQLLDGSYHPLSKRHDGINKDVQDQIKARLKSKQASTGAAAQSPCHTPPTHSPPPASPLTPLLPSPCLEIAGQTSFAKAIFAKTTFLPADEVNKLALVLLEIAAAGKRVASSLSSGAVFKEPAYGSTAADEASTAANKEFLQALNGIPGVQYHSSNSNAMALEPMADSKFAVMVDPLNGSHSLDAGVPGGTVFAVHRFGSDEHTRQQLVAGYILYASATILVITFGDGVCSFTLDIRSGEFMLANTQVEVPPRGQCYALNEKGYGHGYSEPGLNNFVQAIQQGNGQTKRPYSCRSSASIVADFHRMLVQGGVLLNPGNHLRLIHEAMPLSFIVEQAGGQSTDGRMRLLDHSTESRLDICIPAFFGSMDDMAELGTYLQPQPHAAHGSMTL
mmetsp:Transcript_6157/g.17180  ORF Transcript_6157/g.17180 Transcript_6157/m.17180 type:complete len:696 (-) Transcript_6157:669-2756(-)|eukprot:CAMPEP_0117675938 /NCGR_PEP_ID=MMETSP0804-20121206/15882_1 /TAXON_ID=1074897 /ORGANISM="Tetraselmis astigmatica, Strain CCMP880" /LENGTH=695 /DNA_ID=CAMNT_0005484995 /DNA_START=809 /DNA_END=2896 /DNA_ORIENTATION=-